MAAGPARRARDTGRMPSPSPFVAPLELGLCVADLDRMVAFYVDVLGCSVAGRAALPRTRTSAIGLGAGDIALVWLQTATGERIKLLQPSDAPAPAAHDDHLTARRGVAYLTFHVDDLVARSAAAVAAGATALTGDLVHDPGTGVVVSFFRDPEGNVIELVDRADLAAYRADLT